MVQLTPDEFGQKEKFKIACCDGLFFASSALLLFGRAVGISRYANPNWWTSVLDPTDADNAHLQLNLSEMPRSQHYFFAPQLRELRSLLKKDEEGSSICRCSCVSITIDAAV